MADNKINIRKLEADLWESADLLRAGSKLTSSQYCPMQLKNWRKMKHAMPKVI